ncbi:unnamed protein product, partial [Acidithrix sp. C25]
VAQPIGLPTILKIGTANSQVKVAQGDFQCIVDITNQTNCLVEEPA